MKKTLFYGAGNISQSIIKGLIKNGVSKKDILFIDRNPSNTKELLKMGIKSISKNQLNNEIGIIILAIKPKDTFQACQEIADKIDSPNIVSVVRALNSIRLSSILRKLRW